MGSHGAVASQALHDPELVAAVLEDWRTAAIPERLKAVLAFLEKLTLHPQQVGLHDVAPLRAAGVTRAAIADAIHACAAFNIIDRIADSLNSAAPHAPGFAAGAKRLLRRGDQ